MLWQRLGELRGRRFRCHCAPGAPCHSDALVRPFCGKTAVSEVGVRTSVGPASTVSGGRREASAAVPEVGVCTSGGSAMTVRALPAAPRSCCFLPWAAVVLRQLCRRLVCAPPWGSASTVRAFPATAQI